MKLNYVVRLALTWLFSLNCLAAVLLLDHYVGHGAGLWSMFCFGASFTMMRTKLSHWALYNEWPWK